MPIECKFICEECAKADTVANPLFMPQGWTAFGPFEKVTVWTDRAAGHLFVCSEECYQALISRRGMKIVESKVDET